LRPSDRFSNELAPEKGWEFDDGLKLLPLALSKRFGGRPEEYDLIRHGSLGSLFRTVDAMRRKSEIGAEFDD
jgi:hypothetical protein